MVHKAAGSITAVCLLELRQQCPTLPVLASPLLCSELPLSLAGRDEAQIEYDVGFEADGNITALAIRGWFLTGAELDLGDNDPQVLPSGIDQVGLVFGQKCNQVLCQLQGMLCTPDCSLAAEFVACLAACLLAPGTSGWPALYPGLPVRQHCLLSSTCACSATRARGACQWT